MTVIEEIAAERVRAVEAEGWTAEHDDLHVDGEIAAAAAAYILHDTIWATKIVTPVRVLWPWGYSWWKPKDRRRNLIRAAQLIVAEIERLDRAQADAEPSP